MTCHIQKYSSLKCLVIKNSYKRILRIFLQLMASKWGDKKTMNGKNNKLVKGNIKAFQIYKKDL